MKKAAYGFIAVLLVLCTGVIAGGAKNEQRLHLRFYCNNREVCSYYDAPISSADFLISTQIAERELNAELGRKRQKMQELKKEGKDLRSCVLECFPRLKGVVSEAISKTEILPHDSTVQFVASREVLFRIYPERDGLKADEDEIYRQIYAAIVHGDEKICLKLHAVKARVGINDNRKLICCKARFQTDLTSSISARKHNVELALSRLNGAVIEPGATLSFNERVGERTEQNGFETAKIIVDGEYVDGVGGGVCQASTTLYNCALLSGLKIVSVRAHSLRPSYVSPSFDAMVNANTSDLKIKNEDKTPVFVRAYLADDKATVEIYGRKNEYEIKRISKIISEGEIPPDKIISKEQAGADAAVGRKSYGAPQIKSEGYLAYYKDGILLKTQKIRTDVYKEKQGVIIR